MDHPEAVPARGVLAVHIRDPVPVGRPRRLVDPGRVGLPGRPRADEHAPPAPERLDDEAVPVVLLVDHGRHDHRLAVRRPIGPGVVQVGRLVDRDQPAEAAPVRADDADHAVDRPAEGEELPVRREPLDVAAPHQPAEPGSVRARDVDRFLRPVVGDQPAVSRRALRHEREIGGNDGAEPRAVAAHAVRALGAVAVAREQEPVSAPGRAGRSGGTERESRDDDEEEPADHRAGST